MPPGYIRDLFVELFLGLVVATEAQRQPRRLPMRVRSTRSIGETLLQFAESVERLIVLVMHEMQIRHREQRLLEPRARRRGLPEFVYGAVEGFILVRCPCDLAEDVEALRTLFCGRSGEA